MESKQPADVEAYTEQTPPHVKRAQVPRACQRCKTLRRGCSEFRPCRRCVDSGLGDQCTPLSYVTSAPTYASSFMAASPSCGLEGAQRMAELAPIGVVDYCADRFFTRLYPTIPILTPDYIGHLKTRVLSDLEGNFESQCVLIAMCAQVLLQAEDAEQLFTQGTMSETNAVYGQMILDHVLAAHHSIPRNVKPTLEQCLLAFFLYACQASLSHHSQAFLFLREATTLFSLLVLEKIEPAFQEVSRNLFWVLLVSERSHAIRYRRPITLQVTAETPKLRASEASLEGFQSLADLFCPIDTSLVAILNYELVAIIPSPEAVDRVEAAVHTALKPFLDLHETQKANLRVTQLWLRIIIWKLRLRLGYLGEGSHKPSLTYRYPLEVAKEVTLSTRDLSIDSIKVHGVGITEKLYDIASAVVDVLARVPVSPSAPQGPIMGTSMQNDLVFIRHLIGKLPGGTSTYDPLLETQIQQTLSIPAAGLCNEVS